MDFTPQICSEEGEDCLIGRKGAGLRFQEFTRYDLHCLPVEKQNRQISLPFSSAEKTAHFDEKVFFHQRTGPHLRHHHSQIAGILLQYFGDL